MLGGGSDQIALRHEDRTITYGELAAAVDSLTTGLLDSGRNPGDRVALFMPNCPELVMAYLACFAAGLVAVPVNTRYRAPEVSYAVSRSRAGLMIVHPAVAVEAGERPEQRWRIDDAGGPWQSALGTNARPVPDVELASPALILFTSGSTAAPKGVTHSHATMSHTVTVQATVQELEADDVNLITLAMCHIAGLFGQLLPTLQTGGTCILHSHFEPEAAVRDIDAAGVTRIQLLPAQLSSLLDAAEASGSGLASLRCAIAGGDALSADVHRRFRDLTGFEVTEVCGMTESFNYAMNPPLGPKRQGSIGRPTPGNELRLSDRDGKEPPLGEPGEILVRSRGTMVGYWDDPEHTAETLRDGWLHTGDVARLDADAWFWFVGRSKELIIRGGSNVAPGEVEAVLHAHPDVGQAVVVGVPDRTLGQRIAAWVAPNDCAVLTSSQLKTFVRSRIADYKTPEWIFVEPELPTNSVGKIDRAALSRTAAERVSELVS